MIEFLLTLFFGFLAHSLARKLRIPFIALILLFAFLSKPLLGGANIEELAQLGSIMLLYTIGLELRGRELRMGPKAFLHAFFKILFATLILGFLFYSLTGKPLWSFLLAFTLSISSTAAFSIIVKEEGIEKLRESQFLLTSLVWEDVIAVVGTLTLYYYLSSGSFTLFGLYSTLLLLGIAYAIFLLTKLLERYVVEGEEGAFFFHLFILFFVVWVAHQLGAPEGLAAFLAGLISGRQRSIRIVRERISHFTAFFILVFFFSMGLEVEGLPQPLWLVAVAFLASLAVKVVITALFLMLEGSTPFRAAHFALLFSTTGEFSLVMALSFSPFAGDLVSIVAFVAFLSLLVVPLTLTLSPHLADKLRRIHAPRRRKEKRKKWRGFSRRPFSSLLRVR